LYQKVDENLKILDRVCLYRIYISISSIVLSFENQVFQLQYMTLVTKLQSRHSAITTGSRRPRDKLTFAQLVNIFLAFYEPLRSHFHIGKNPTLEHDCDSVIVHPITTFIKITILIMVMKNEVS